MPYLLAFCLFLLLVCGTTARAAFTLYVSNTGNNTIEKFDASGNATLFATNGVNGVLSNPTGLAMDSLGNLYVANSAFVSNTNDTVVVYDAMGNGGPFAHPATNGAGGVYAGMVFDTAGNLLIADNDNRILWVASGSHGIILKYDYNLSELFDPFSLAFDSAGNLYVANVDNNWIERFAYPATNAIQFITNFANPTGMAFDSAGNLYVASGHDENIWKFDAQGQNKTLFASAFTNNMGAPYGLAFDHAGNLYVADNKYSRIFKFPPGGITGTIFATTGLNHPSFIVLQDPQADLAVSKTVDLTNAYVGATVTFSITVTNPGPNAARPVVVAEQLVSPGLSYLGFNNLYASSSFDGANWTITNLPAGTSAVLQVMARLTATGTQTNTAFIQSSGANDTNANNNAASATVVANPLPPIGGSTYADSADFTLNTTGVSPIIGGVSYSDSADFTLDTTGTLPGTGGVAQADSPDFTLDTTGASGAYADSLDFILDTRGLLPFRLMNPLALPGGAFHFTFTNASNVSFSVYGVTNLRLPFSNWTFLGIVTDNPPGQFQFTDPQGSNYPQRFYRVSSP